MTDNYGYIYCMSNKCMNGVLKIGRTNNNPRLRAEQLFNTSIPCKFEVKFSKRVKNPKQVEKDIHSKLSNKRYPRREFFEVSEEEVKQIFSEIQGEWWDERSDDNQNENIEPEDTSTEDDYYDDDDDDDEPSEDEREDDEDDEEVAYMKTRKATLIEQKETIRQKYFNLINDKVVEIEAKREALKTQIRAYDEEISKMRQTAEHNAYEENKAIQLKLDKVLTFLGECIVKKKPQCKSSGKVVKSKTSTFFSRKQPNEMVNQNTRFIYKQTKGVVFERFCIIIKKDNCVYECDANGMIKSQPFRSLNDFCVSVKKSINYQGSFKQDISVVLKYYDISSCEYKSFKDLSSPLN